MDGSVFKDRLGPVLALTALGGAIGVVVADELPDADLLEYLGSWDDSTEEQDWYLLAVDDDREAALEDALREANTRDDEQTDEVTYEP